VIRRVFAQARLRTNPSTVYVSSRVVEDNDDDEGREWKETRNFK
jgi:hypothetical protein